MSETDKTGVSWFLAIGLAIANITNNYSGLQLEPVYCLDVLRYVPMNAPIPIVTPVVNLFVLVIATGLWIHLQWSWLFVGIFIALVGHAIPVENLGTLPGSLSGFIMALSLLLTVQYLQSRAETLNNDDINPEDLEWDKPPILQSCKNQHKECKKSQEDNKECKDEECGYSIYQAGSHLAGDFIQVYVPNKAKTVGGKVIVITYLHGFALCLPKFYQEHLKCLACSGYYVLFPDFQNSYYPDDFESANQSSHEVEPNLRPLRRAFELVRGRVSAPDSEGIPQTAQSSQKQSKAIARKLAKPKPLEYVRAGLALAAIILLIRIINLLTFAINKRYGKHLTTLIATVGVSLVHRPSEWANHAIDMTAIAWRKLEKDKPELADVELDFYVFGHSLGGLLALSWPHFLQQALEDPHNKSIKDTLAKLKPQKILVADPAPSTAMGIPGFVVFFLKLFNVPFAEDPVTIAETGAALTGTQVGIMHGQDDKLVKPKAWIKPSLFKNKTNYESVGSHKKQIYFSQFDAEDNLLAFHNQAVTDTRYFDDALFKGFGGVKHHPNVYNYDYIWKGLNLVIEDNKDANKLLDYFKNKHFTVVKDVPTGIPILVERIIVAIAIISALVLAYLCVVSGLLSKILSYKAC